MPNSVGFRKTDTIGKNGVGLVKPTLFNNVGFSKPTLFFPIVSVLLKPTPLNSVGFNKTDTT
jgi:hypothetical protein